MDIAGKTGVVSGASSGLGRAISSVLAARGVKVGLLARSKDKLEALRAELEKAGGTAVSVPADVSDPDAVKHAVDAVASKWDGIDILVNNAGLGIFKPIDEMSVDEWDKHINVMLRGAFLLTKHCLPHLYRQQRSHVFMISSLWAKRFCATCSAYTAAKFGVRGLAQSLREEVRQYNVKVTNIMPGTVETPFFEKAGWETDLSRALQPEDVAAIVLQALSLPDRAVIEEIVLQSIRPDACTC